MRSRILGAVGVLWGGGIIIARLAGMTSSGAEAGAYAAGQSAGFVFGLLLLGVGAYYLLKKSKA